MPFYEYINLNMCCPALDKIILPLLPPSNPIIYCSIICPKTGHCSIGRGFWPARFGPGYVLSNGVQLWAP